MISNTEYQLEALLIKLQVKDAAGLIPAAVERAAALGAPLSPDDIYNAFLSGLLTGRDLPTCARMVNVYTAAAMARPTIDFNTVLTAYDACNPVGVLKDGVTPPGVDIPRGIENVSGHNPDQTSGTRRYTANVLIPKPATPAKREELKKLISEKFGTLTRSKPPKK